MKKTVKQLSEEIELMRKQMGNVQYHGYTVWSTEQVKDILDEHDTQNCILKVEITHGCSPGVQQRCYHVDVWRYAPLL